MTFEKFLMDFQPFKGLKFNYFYGEACPQAPQFTTAYTLFAFSPPPPLQNALKQYDQNVW